MLSIEYSTGRVDVEASTNFSRGGTESERDLNRTGYRPEQRNVNLGSINEGLNLMRWRTVNGYGVLSPRTNCLPQYGVANGFVDHDAFFLGLGIRKKMSKT